LEGPWGHREKPDAHIRTSFLLLWRFSAVEGGGKPRLGRTHW
jgi:hypothetical protein